MVYIYILCFLGIFMSNTNEITAYIIVYLLINIFVSEMVVK